MEMNYKDFSSQLKTIKNSKETSHVLYSYSNFLDIIRNDLGENRKNEMDKAIDTNTLSKDNIVIKNKQYFEEQKKSMAIEVKHIIQRKNYHVREYQNNIDGLIKAVVDDLIGYSVLTEAFEDPSVSDIYCLRYDKIFVEKSGSNEKYPHVFSSEKQYNDFIERLVKEAGKELNKGDSKILDMDLYEDRYCITDDSVSPNGKSMTIRKHGTSHVTLEQIVRGKCMNSETARFLGLLIAGESNLIYSGLTGSGKTTALRALLDYYVPKLNKRMLVCEDTRELFPVNEHTLELVTVKNDDPKVAVDLRQLAMTALRLKPKYICVGEVRGK